MRSIYSIGKNIFSLSFIVTLFVDLAFMMQSSSMRDSFPIMECRSYVKTPYHPYGFLSILSERQFYQNEP
jgi:hypothetical protein